MRWLPLLLAQVSVPANPPEPPPLHGGPAPMTCPVGGEAFSAWQPAVYSTYGERPDGKPYSYLPFPFPLPECPGNRLVVFDEYSPVEVTRLAALIATPDYRALLTTDTPYYRAYWLASRLGRSAEEPLWLLLRAGWEVKGGDMAGPARPQLARRYNEAFARGVTALPPGVAPMERVALLARGANAWRELGRFRESREMTKAARAAFATPGTKVGGDWGRYLDRLDAAIARRDVSLEPLDLIPPREAARRCLQRAGQLSASERALCAAPAIASPR